MARILVIDDEPNLRTILGLTLRAAGHEAVLAADGREGLRQHRAQAVDLVITDLFMPEVDGFEAISAFGKLSPQVPTIAMSGEGQAGPLLSMAEALGVRATLGKPFSSARLLAAVQAALDAGKGAIAG